MRNLLKKIKELFKNIPDNSLCVCTKKARYSTELNYKKGSGYTCPKCNKDVHNFK